VVNQNKVLASSIFLSSLALPSGQNRQKKQSEGVRSKHSAMLLKIHSSDCFFADFAHWVKSQTTYY